MFGQRLNGFRYTHAIIGFGGEATLWWMHFLKKSFNAKALNILELKVATVFSIELFI